MTTETVLDPDQAELVQADAPQPPPQTAACPFDGVQPGKRTFVSPDEHGGGAPPQASGRRSRRGAADLGSFPSVGFSLRHEFIGTKAQRFTARQHRSGRSKLRRGASSGGAAGGVSGCRGRWPHGAGTTPGAISRFQRDPISIGKWLSCSTPFSPMLTH